jgi:hypothetical protein
MHRPSLDSGEDKAPTGMGYSPHGVEHEPIRVQFERLPTPAELHALGSFVDREGLQSGPLRGGNDHEFLLDLGTNCQISRAEMVARLKAFLRGV